MSTRGGMAPSGFADVLIDGIAPDGGLVVPDSVPRFGEEALADLAAAPYPEVAAAVVTRFAPELDGNAVAAACATAYGADRFDHPDVVSLRPLGDGLVLAGLSHGPTLAFKDMAMQLLAELLGLVLGERDQRLIVLGATSGDTGSAAEHAFSGSSRVEVVMLSPLGRMTPFQAAQMYTVDAPNIHNLAVRGVFDQCQDLVKQVSTDADLVAGQRLGTVNSINWGRVVAQVAYYLYAALRIAGPGGGEVSFAVPTGNFGNVYAGLVARRMGAPIRRLVVATNENDVLAELFATGRYRVRRPEEVVATSSPSMDIARASNLERYVYDLVGGDGRRVTELFARPGGFELGDAAAAAVAATGLVAGTSTHADRIATIRSVHDRWGIIVDPHTADGITVGRRFAEDGVPMVCLETAQPAKFAATIVEALGREPPIPPRLAGLLDLPQRFEVIDPMPEAVRSAITAAADPPIGDL